MKDDTLHELTIRQQLMALGLTTPATFHLLPTVDSTNRFLKDLPIAEMLDICCAETQTQGRGRFGRAWHSPLGENIYCSSRWYFKHALKRLSGFSLVVSLAVLAALADLGLDQQVRIKWPNDLLWREKKLCGNLIEILPIPTHSVAVIIGIGLNVNAIESNAIDRPWCSLYQIYGRKFDRNTLIAHMIAQLYQHIERFNQAGFSAFTQHWQQVDGLYGREIRVQGIDGLLTGQACGINHEGQLILKDKLGMVHYLSSGDTSLSPMKSIP